MKQMLKAKTSIDFAMFTFAQSSGIDDTMIRLVGPVPRIRGVLDRGQGVQQWAATQPLKAAGVQLFENKPGTGVRKVHHKLMVIDERLVIVGSFNYTGPGDHPQRREHHRPRRPRRDRPGRRGRATAARQPSRSPRSTASSPISACPCNTSPAVRRTASHSHELQRVLRNALQTCRYVHPRPSSHAWFLARCSVLRSRAQIGSFVRVSSGLHTRVLAYWATKRLTSSSATAFGCVKGARCPAPSTSMTRLCGTRCWTRRSLA